MSNRAIQHVIIAPRWAGTPQSDWYPWIVPVLSALLPAGGVVKALDLPALPTVENTPERIAAHLALNPNTLPNTLLVGHSVGCQAILRALCLHPAQAGGLLMVAGWWSIDSPWDSIRPWLAPFSVDHIPELTPFVDVLLSDNDPYTTDFRANQGLWRARLRAEVQILPGLKHFNRPEEPAVLEAISRRLQAQS